MAFLSTGINVVNSDISKKIDDFIDTRVDFEHNGYYLDSAYGNNDNINNEVNEVILNVNETGIVLVILIRFLLLLSSKYIETIVVNIVIVHRSQRR